jgi:hypothetical protein
MGDHEDQQVREPNRISGTHTSHAKLDLLGQLWAMMELMRTGTPCTNATWGELDRGHSYDELCRGS